MFHSLQEGLEEIQQNIEAEQQTLATEQARQNRVAASVSNEMFTECQVLKKQEEKWENVSLMMCKTHKKTQFLDSFWRRLRARNLSEFVRLEESSVYKKTVMDCY